MGRHSLPIARQYAGLLSSLRVFIDNETQTRALGITLELAAKHALTSYDAAYLELALRQQLPLATLDKALIRAAEAEAVPLFWSSAPVTN